MGLKKVTGVPEIDSMIAGFNKNFTKDAIEELTKYDLRGAISTGSIALDKATGIGGIPMGRITEILGENSGGKTSLAMQILTNAQEMRKTDGDMETMDLVIDLERTITDKFMRGFGIDTDRVLHLRPSSAEAALQLAKDLPKSGKIGVVIFDSVAAGQSLRQQKRNIGEADVGGISKLMHDTLRSVVNTSEETGTTYIFINQITYKIGVMFGNPETSPGGEALKFYSSMRLKMMAGKAAPNVPGAMLMRVKFYKNKVAAPFQGQVPIVFYYGKGVDRDAEVMDLARTAGILKHSAGQSKVQWSGELEHETIHPDVPRGRLGCEDFFGKTATSCLGLKIG